MVTCKNCGKDKDINSFYITQDKRYKRSYIQGSCKECALQQMKAYVEDNRDTVSRRRKKYYEANKEKVYLENKKWRKENRDKCNAYNKKYRDANKDKIKAYREKIKDRQREYYRRRMLERRRNDPVFNLNSVISNAIYRSLKAVKAGRNWEAVVGYTLGDLMNHLESQFTKGMNWENYGKNGWEVDHIRPKSSFNYTHPEDLEFKECWGLENLQPLWAEENNRKSNRWEKDLMEAEKDSPKEE